MRGSFGRSKADIEGFSNMGSHVVAPLSAVKKVRKKSEICEAGILGALLNW